MQNNYQKIGNVWLTILLLSFSYIGQSSLDNQAVSTCEDKTFTTSQTKCTITFTTCPGNSVNKFLNCTISNCQRHLGTQNCQRSLDFTLQEQSCYTQCCKSTTFNQTQCESVNAQLKQVHQSQDSFIILSLIIVSAGLLAFTLIFFLVVLKCNKEEENKKNLDQSHSLINWIDVKYSNEKCDSCMGYGAVILTPCSHWYHESCYMKELMDDQIKCNKCPQKMFSTLRVFCRECRQKQFKIRVQKVSILKEIITEGMIQHSKKCQHFNKDLCTDIRLTSTGSSSSD